MLSLLTSLLRFYYCVTCTYHTYIASKLYKRRHIYTETLTLLNITMLLGAVSDI
jgi:hypothetical protein